MTILVSKITPAISNLIGQLSTCESVWDVIAMILVVSMETIELPNAANLGVCNLIGQFVLLSLSHPILNNTVVIYQW